MNHQPFEKWLFSDGLSEENAELTPENEILFKEHLQNCSACQALENAWKNVEHGLGNSPMFSPAPGFTQRWQERLELEQARMEMKHAYWLLTLYTIGALLVLFPVFAVLQSIFRSPMSLVWSYLYNLVSILKFYDGLLDFLRIMLRSIIEIVPSTLWFALGLSFSGLSAIWFLALRRLSTQRRTA